MYEVLIGTKKSFAQGKKDEIYILKGQKRCPKNDSRSINQRMENVILSLAHVENAYRDKYPDTSITFDQWLTGGVKMLGVGDVRRKYIEALSLPIHGYKKVHCFTDADDVVHGFNKAGDSYYQQKLNAGLITPFTEAELKKRSFSVKQENLMCQSTTNDENGKEIDIDTWMATSISSQEEEYDLNYRFYAEDPESLLLAKQFEEGRRKRIAEILAAEKFKPHEIEVALEYFDRIREGLDGWGYQKEMSKDLSITKGKLQYLIKRLDKLIAETA